MNNNNALLVYIYSIYDKHKIKLDNLKENRAKSEEEKWTDAEVIFADSQIVLLASVLSDLNVIIQNNPIHKFNVDRKDFYASNLPCQNYFRTRGRLVEIANIGLEVVMTAEFGYKGVFSGLYIEYIWSYSDEQWKDYIDWVKKIISKTL